MAQMILLDTDILIDYFRGLPNAKSYIAGIPLAQRATTDVTLLELFQGAQNKRELMNIGRFITANFTQILPISTSASRIAVGLVKQYTLAKGLALPDALIAALVLSVGGKLITGNERHFEFIQRLDVEAPAYRTPPSP